MGMLKKIIFWDYCLARKIALKDHIMDQTFMLFATKSLSFAGSIFFGFLFLAHIEYGSLLSYGFPAAIGILIFYILKPNFFRYTQKLNLLEAYDNLEDSQVRLIIFISTLLNILVPSLIILIPWIGSTIAKML